jgi:sterol desaturase/sphingolipid hydroxylase (fatty acid hydroxylase superfamily)
VEGLSPFSMRDLYVYFLRLGALGFGGRWSRAHALPNLTLTVLAFVTYAVLHGGVAVALALFETHRIGLFPLLGLGALGSTVIALLALDFVTYVAHVAMHKVPAFWRFHRVHHSDPAVDVTTSLRQQPLATCARRGSYPRRHRAVGSRRTRARAWSRLR